MPQKTNKKTKRNVGLLYITAILLAVFMQLVLVSAADKRFDQILTPIKTIYDLVKYSVTVIAGLLLLYAGITYMTSGSDPRKREQAKNILMYVIIGLIVIWAAPFLVELIVGK